MRQSLKYGRIMVLVLLLHLVGMGTVCTVDTSSSSLPLTQEACFISSSHTVQGTIDRFHFFNSPMPGEMGHADLSHVPTDKSFLLLISRFCEYQMMNNHQLDGHLHRFSYYFPDPVQYYVYGLRKIVV